MLHKKSNTINEVVINWHVTEACNYSCRYCYAHWDRDISCRELIHDKDKTNKLLENISNFFQGDNNHISNLIKSTSVRLNIAGGEPLLYPKRVLSVAKKARELGMNVSIITNGSLLTSPLMKKLAPELSILGISLDSSSSHTNSDIGRKDRKNEQLSIYALNEIISEGLHINPEMKLKVNTVVNSINCNEDISSIIKLLNPNRWKVFKMLPVLNSDLALSERDYREYIQRHHDCGVNICSEDNDEMTESYIMIDPKGRFFQNSNCIQGGYKYSPLILEEGIEAAFSNIRFSSKKYVDRYSDLLSNFNQSTVQGGYV